MITIYDLKPAFQGLLRPLANRLARSGVSANQVTIAALLLSIAHGAWIGLASDPRPALLALPVTLFLRMALNAVDGMLAREHGQASRLGALLNEVGDVISDLALYIPFALLPWVPLAALTAAVVMAGLTEFAGVAALLIGASRRYDGPMGKSDRAFAFGLLSLLMGLGWAPLWLISGLLWLLAVLGVFTLFNRCRKALEESS